MESSAIRAYEIFKELNLSPETAKEMAEIVTTSRDEHLEKWVASKDDVYAVKEDLARVKLELKEDMASVRVEIASAQSSTNRWLIGIAFTMTGVLSGIVFTMMKLMR